MRTLLICALVLGWSFAPTPGTEPSHPAPVALEHVLNAGLAPVFPGQLDRSTPFASVQGFLKAAHRGDYPLAAHYLDLRHYAVETQAAEGARLARRLRFILDRQPWLGLSSISHNPEGDAGRRDREQIGLVEVDKVMVPVGLVAVSSGGQEFWVFDRATVQAIDRLYETYGPPLGEVMPEVFFTRPLKGLEIWQWIGLLLVLLAATLAAYLSERILLALGRRITRLTPVTWDDQLVAAGKGPLKIPVWAGLVSAGTRSLLLPPNVQGGFQLLCHSLVVIAAAWFCLRFLGLIAQVVQRNVVHGKGELASERAVRTQLAVLQRVLSVVIYIVSAAVLLMQFSVVRTVGVSLLASAGVAGIIFGLAAQKPIGSLLSGIQLSITQPIRIGDSVVVEGETGTIEEISLTYVVVRIWDLRRLIVPITYFLEKPFQNWSKGPPEMLGTVVLQVDYHADVEAFRTELQRILANEGKALWDGKTASLGVTDCTERTQTLRVLVSAADSGLNWDLRCLVREKLINFLKQHPAWFPTNRTQTLTPPADSPPANPAAPPQTPPSSRGP